MPDSESVILYGCPPSLYSGKVRSYLRKAGISYEERLQSHPDYKTKILPVVGRMVIPVLETPSGTIIQDTTEIIDFLEKNSEQPLGIYPSTPQQKIVSLIIEMFGDEGLLRPAMHYRWNFPEQNDYFISMEFGRFMNPNSTEEEAYQLAAMPKAAMQRYLPGLGITPASIPAIEQKYKNLLAALNEHFLHHPYILGGKPTIADFGLYGPMYAHLARDPAPEMLMKTTANRVWRWVERMTAPDRDAPEFPNIMPETTQGDMIPDTLKAILKLIAQDYLPEIEALVAFINTHLEHAGPFEAGTPIITDANKRVLGGITVPIGEAEVSIGARHYSLWMLQRVQAAFDVLDQIEQTQIVSLLTEVGLNKLISVRTHQSISRINYKEVWA
jgi:glutathione S-transferase